MFKVTRGINITTEAEDMVKDGVVAISRLSRDGLATMEVNSLQVSRGRLHRVGSHLPEIKYGGLIGSGAQAVLTGLTSMSTRARSMPRVSMVGS